MMMEMTNLASRSTVTALDCNRSRNSGFSVGFRTLLYGQRIGSESQPQVNRAAMEYAG